MKDGYYLSTYIHIHPLAYAYKMMIRHDQNMSLWKKCGENIRLVRYWELERITGQKQHSLSFASTEKAINFIENLLKKEGIKLEDICEIWGTPEIETNKDYYNSHCETFQIHNMAHLYSGILCNTDIFYNENILAFSVDGGPDNVLDNGDIKTHLFNGAYISQGKIISVFPCNSPGYIWTKAADYFGLKEGTLMALLSSSKCEFIDDTTYYKKLTSMNIYITHKVIEEMYQNAMEAIKNKKMIYIIHMIIYLRKTRMQLAW